MKRRIALLLSLTLAATLVGCGVSQEVYQSEYVHARDLEAKNEDLVERLGAQTSAREAADSRAFGRQRVADISKRIITEGAPPVKRMPRRRAAGIRTTRSGPARRSERPTGQSKDSVSASRRSGNISRL